MSTIDSNQSLNAILDKLGVNKQEEATTKRRDQLGQADFLKLMTTQLQNQDPFAPMDNADFIAQMAQFSTVTGITDMGQTLKGMSDQLQEFRIATASNLLGHSVLVPGNLHVLMKMVKSTVLLTCRQARQCQISDLPMSRVKFCIRLIWALSRVVLLGSVG